MSGTRTPFRAWRWAAGATMAFGLGGAVVVWGVLGPAATVALFCIPVALLAWLAGLTPAASTRLGTLGAAGLVASGGLVATCGAAGALLVVLVVSTSPFVRIALRSGALRSAVRHASSWDEVVSVERAGHQVPAPANGDGLRVLTGMPAADRVPVLDDRALCDAWRRSYVRLQACSTTGVRHEVVRRRQLYLDELVRRHPAGAQRWFDSGARAAGNPYPFLAAPSATRDGESDGPDQGVVRADDER
jgi:hypothetical protein